MILFSLIGFFLKEIIDFVILLIKSTQNESKNIY